MKRYVVSIIIFGLNISDMRTQCFHYCTSNKFVLILLVCVITVYYIKYSVL